MPPRKTKEAAASPKKEKAAKAKKDPNAPKKPSGAYIFFCNDKRAEVKKANPEFGVAESGRELGSMWKAASEADKEVGPAALASNTGCLARVVSSKPHLRSLLANASCCCSPQKYKKQAEQDKERDTKELAA